jgi:hypothetical protein
MLSYKELQRQLKVAKENGLIPASFKLNQKREILEAAYNSHLAQPLDEGSSSSSKSIASVLSHWLPIEDAIDVAKAVASWDNESITEVPQQEQEQQEELVILPTVQQIANVTDNFIPVCELAKVLKLDLVKDHARLWKAIFKLQRTDVLEVSTLSDVSHFTNDDLSWGYKMTIGGCSFFLMLNY